MKIKKIVLQNFKSYLGKHHIDISWDGVVQLVGSNGSGKSAILEAVAFLLRGMDGLKHYRDRVQCISYNKKSCLVEVTFSEVSDLDVEIIFGRYLTPSKDCFYINHENVSKKTFAYVLEFFGFSLPEPLIHLNDDFITKFVDGEASGRMDLMMNCAGFRFVQTRDSIVGIKNILTGLEKELVLLKARCNSVQKKGESRRSDKLRLLREIIASVKIVMSQRVIASCESRIQEITSSKMSQPSQAIGQKEMEDTSLAMKVEEMRVAQTRRRVVESRLQQINQERRSSGESEKDTDKGFELFQIEKDLKIRKKEAEEARNALRKKEIELDKAMTGSSVTPEETVLLLEDKLRKLGQIERVLTSDENELKSLEEECNVKLKAETELKTRKEKDLQGLEKLYETMLEDLKNCHKKEQELQEELVKVTKSCAEKKRSLSFKIGKNIVDGIESARVILENWKNSNNPVDKELRRNCFGFVIDNFECNDQKIVQHCIGIVAGQSLFHLIVQNQRVVFQIINEMTRLKLPGKINFILMNKITVPDLRPLGQTSDYHLLRQEINCSSKFSSVIDMIFGNIVLCRNGEIACATRRTHNMACVSTEGYMFMKDGTIEMSAKMDEPLLYVYERWVWLQKEEIEKKNQIADIRKQIQLIQSKMSKISMNSHNIETELLKFDLFVYKKKYMEAVEKRVKKKEELAKFMYVKQLVENQLEQARRSPVSGEIPSSEDVETLNRDMVRLKATSEALDSEIKCLEAKWKAKKLNDIYEQEENRKACPRTSLSSELIDLLSARQKLQFVIETTEKEISDAVAPPRAAQKKRKEDTSDGSDDIAALTKEIQQHRAVLDDIKKRGFFNVFVVGRYKNFSDDELKALLKENETLLKKEEDSQNAQLGNKIILKNALVKLDKFGENLNELKNVVTSLNQWLDQSTDEIAIDVRRYFIQFLKMLSPRTAVDFSVSTNTYEMFLVANPQLVGENGDVENQDQLRRLQPFEKVFMATAFLMATRRAQNFNFVFLDEVDKVLSGQQAALFRNMLAKIKDMQLFFVSHSGALVYPEGPYFSATAAHSGSKLALMHSQDDD